MSIHSKTKGEGFPVIFIHGFCEAAEIWDPFLDLLPDSFKSIAIDLPGFGKSLLKVDVQSLDTIAQNVHQWIIGSGVKAKPIIVGHSLGGYAALALMHQFPKSYSGLILFHSTALADTEEKKGNRNKVIEFVEANGTVPFVETFIPSLFYNKDKNDLDFALQIAKKTPKSTFLAYTRFMRDRPSRVDVLRLAPWPVMLIAGQFDSVIPVLSLEEQARLNPSIQLEVLPSVGHMGMFEARNKAADIINTFVQQVKSREGH